MTGIGLYLAQQMRLATEADLESSLSFASFTVVDGTAWQDQPFYADIADSSHIVLPEGYALSSYVVTLYGRSDDSPTFTIVTPAEIVAFEDDLRYRIEARAVKPGAPSLALDRSAAGRGVQVAPIALADPEPLFLLQGMGPVFIGFDAFFGPAIPTGSFDADAPVAIAPPQIPGVSFVPGGMIFDTDGLAEQLETTFLVQVGNDNPVPSDLATVALTVTANPVTAVVPPTLMQGYAGNDLLTLSNRDMLLDPGNYTGLNVGDYITLSALRDQTLFNLNDTGYRLRPGEVYTLSATGPGTGEPVLRLTSPPMTVLDWLSITEESGLWAFSIAPDIPNFAVRGRIVDGVENDVGLTTDDLRAGDVQFVQTHAPLPPVVPAEPELGDVLVLREPVLLCPAQTAPTKQVERLRDGVVVSGTVLEQDDDATGQQSRTTYSAPGLTSLVSISPATPVMLPDIHDPNVFVVDGTSHWENTRVADRYDGASQFLFAGWFEGQSANVHIFDGVGNRIRLTGGGGVNFWISDSSGASHPAVSLNCILSPGVLTHLALWVDFANDDFVGVVNGVDRTSAGTTRHFARCNHALGRPTPFGLYVRQNAGEGHHSGL